MKLLQAWRAKREGEAQALPPVPANDFEILREKAARKALAKGDIEGAWATQMANWKPSAPMGLLKKISGVARKILHIVERDFAAGHNLLSEVSAMTVFMGVAVGAAALAGAGVGDIGLVALGTGSYLSWCKHSIIRERREQLKQCSPMLYLADGNPVGFSGPGDKLLILDNARDILLDAFGSVVNKTPAERERLEAFRRDAEKALQHLTPTNKSLPPGARLYCMPPGAGPEGRDASRMPLRTSDKSGAGYLLRSGL
jgi:hypothetical protein